MRCARDFPSHLEMHEEKERSRLTRTPEPKGITLIFDEIESHLHPEWQRSIVPSLLDTIDLLAKGEEFQMFSSTHSPLVLASVETRFNSEKDRLFLLELDKHRESAVVEQLEWTPRGTMSYWLTSPAFGLTEARSCDAEAAIQAAKHFMVGNRSNLPDGLRTIEEIHEALKKSLPGQDPFWPRWMVKTGMED